MNSTLFFLHLFVSAYPCLRVYTRKNVQIVTNLQTPYKSSSWIHTCEVMWSHVKSCDRMWSHVITCENLHVPNSCEFIFTNENSHDFTCENSRAPNSHAPNSHVNLSHHFTHKNYMISHVKIRMFQIHMFQIHMWISHVNLCGIKPVHKLCSYCLFRVIGTSLEQAVNNL